ncbi:MAG: primosomal protein N', partial [Candidatus Binatia bacterium]|nr:primosomal protein N' [Candidatus Binatia bacterium]
LIQTRQPEHPSLNFALEHDFRGFAAGELTSRAALAYPPFGRLVRVIIEGPAEESAQHAERVAHHLRRAAGSLEGVEPGEVMVLGPAPAPIERLRGRDRHQILIKGKDAPQITQTLARARLASGTTDKTRTIIDVDPAGML